MNQKLNKLIDEYLIANDRAKEATSIKSTVAGQLKNLLEEENLEEAQSSEARVTYKLSTKVTVNEEKLLACIKRLAESTSSEQIRKQLLSSIITVEKVDEEYLETLIYDGVLSPEDIEDSYTSTQSKTLRCYKLKK